MISSIRFNPQKNELTIVLLGGEVINKICTTSVNSYDGMYDIDGFTEEEKKLLGWKSPHMEPYSKFFFNGEYIEVII